MDQISASLWVVNPITCDYTEVSAVPLAPKGESEEMRNQRSRQYETWEAERSGAMKGALRARPGE